jgi:hypothetical protein
MRIACVVLFPALLTTCAPAPAPPPPNRVFDGLPITGNRHFAEAMGFTRCLDTASALRCRREGVNLFGTGPYSAAVDLDRNGRSGFRLLTLWHDGNQNAVHAVSDALGERGWHLCRTGWADRGDQEIWTKPGARIRVMMDLSYWGKRRVRVLPEQGQPTGHCW